MPQINTGDFKKGVKVLIDGDPYNIIECNFVKPGKGQALYRTKLRNLLKGTILDRTYKSGDGLESADVHKSDGQYSYRDGTDYVFMDNKTYDQFNMAQEACQDKVKFLREGDNVEMLFFNGQLIEITPPAQAILEVTYTEPAAKGNTATNVTKAATVETGAEIQVPAFIAQGDKIKIQTESGDYVERVRS